MNNRESMLNDLADLLENHDGDDRCRCLNNAVQLLASEGNADEQLRQVGLRLSQCRSIVYPIEL